MLIFKAKTSDGYVIKTLAELLQNNIKTACFEIDNSGIFLRMMDQNRTILIDLNLDANCFTLYSYKAQENKLYLGINLDHFHKMLKSVKKKEAIQLSIDDENPTELSIKIFPKNSNRVTNSQIKIQNIQNIEIELPEGYSKPVIVNSGEFQKMCKDLSHISNITNITTKGFLITFSNDAGGVMKRSIDFGEPEESDEEATYDEEYSDDFDTEQLTKVTKLSGLCNNMQVFAKAGVPLLIRSNVGNMGKISIYLKSRALQATDSRTIPSEEEN